MRSYCYKFQNYKILYRIIAFTDLSRYKITLSRYIIHINREVTNINKINNKLNKSYTCKYE